MKKQTGKLITLIAAAIASAGVSGTALARGHGGHGHGEGGSGGHSHSESVGHEGGENHSSGRYSTTQKLGGAMLATGYHDGTGYNEVVQPVDKHQQALDAAEAQRRLHVVTTFFEKIGLGMIPLMGLGVGAKIGTGIRRRAISKAEEEGIISSSPDVYYRGVINYWPQDVYPTKSNIRKYGCHT